MNKQESDILNMLFNEPYINQKILAETSGHSLGAVNKCIKNLLKDGLLNYDMRLTEKARQEVEIMGPRNAIILAAGFGMRMVPINTQCPKALMEVNGEPLIERIIKQLQEVNVTEIYVVVGFMKEQFEYLIDEYGVDLIVNEQYLLKNNLHSLAIIADHISNTYIVPSDIWCEKNPFHKYELYSWYMVSDSFHNESNVRVNCKMELVSVLERQRGNVMIGISYVVGEQSGIVKERLKKYDMNSIYDNSFWEETLFENNHMIVQAKVVHASIYLKSILMNNYENLIKNQVILSLMQLM